MVAPAVPLISKPAEGQEVGLILGRKPGSKYEWYTAVALVRYGWRFDYQIPIAGARLIAGGQVLDFMVYTLPLRTPLYVYGPYWHEQKRRDHDRLLRIALYNIYHGSINIPVVFEEKHCRDQASALAAVRKYFGRAS